MNDFPKKLDLFTAFAAEKITKHSRDLTENSNDQFSTEAGNTFSAHEQLLDKELTTKIHELTCSEEALLEPSLEILKQYYLSLLKSRYIDHTVK